MKSRLLSAIRIDVLRCLHPRALILAMLFLAVARVGWANPVDVATGNYVLQVQDIGIPTTGLPLDLTRTYNSAAAEEDGPLGFG